MPRKLSLCRSLAAAFAGGPWTLDELVVRAASVLGQRPRWLRSLARRVLRTFPDPDHLPSRTTLATFLDQDRGLTKLRLRPEGLLPTPGRLVVRDLLTMMPAPGAPASWDLPALTTPGALADWLSLTPGELDWFADCRGHEARVPAGPLRHYTYYWLAKSSGKLRLVENPKQRLKAIQRRLLRQILDHIPPHAAAKGYRRGQSIVTYAAPHACQRIVFRFDLRDFFPSVRRARVHALFHTAGYPEAVARLLAGLCTNVVPPDVVAMVPSLARPRARPLLFANPHLPQGARTSPALANLCAFRLDCRLAGLAQSVCARYTRYADDLAFSGGEALERSARRFQVLVCRIALEEEFEVNTRKSRFMRQGVRQQLAGVVVNRVPNFRRDEYDRLKAILTNCVRHGPASQNRAGHTDFHGYLAGRLAYVTQLNAARGQKLRRIFERIEWKAAGGPGSE